ASADADTQATRFTTGRGIVVGTPGYIAPEQMFGAPATTRSDLFAFGVVVHEMLTGSHPFSRGSVTDTAAAIPGDDAAPLGPAGTGRATGGAEGGGGAGEHGRPSGRGGRALWPCTWKQSARLPIKRRPRPPSIPPRPGVCACEGSPCLPGFSAF